MQQNCFCTSKNHALFYFTATLGPNMSKGTPEIQMSHLRSDMREESPTAVKKVEVDQVIKMECMDIKVEPSDTGGGQTEASNKSNVPFHDFKNEPLETEDDKTEKSNKPGLVTNTILFC